MLHGVKRSISILLLKLLGLHQEILLAYRVMRSLLMIKVTRVKALCLVRIVVHIVRSRTLLTRCASGSLR